MHKAAKGKTAGKQPIAQIPKHPNRRVFLKALGAAAIAGFATTGHRNTLKPERIEKKPVFRLSVRNDINPAVRERIIKMAGIGLNFLQEKKLGSFSGRNIKVWVGEFEGTEKLFDNSQAGSFGGIKTPNYYAVTIADFEKGKSPEFNIHLSWKRVKESFGSLPDAEQRAVLRSFGLLFNEIGGSVLVAEKYRRFVERSSVTPELRRRMEIESFELGISILENFVDEKFKQNDQMRKAMLGEIEFQKKLLESWKQLKAR
jgi:hypothetical protein